MILYENMKAIEHVALQPICAGLLSHLMCALLNTLKLLMSLSLQKTQISRNFNLDAQVD